ncbi:putative holin [Pseudescherichia vulneris]
MITKSIFSDFRMADIVHGVDPRIIVAAFAGSIVFVVSAQEFTFCNKILLFSVSLLIGIYSADFASTLLATALSATFGTVFLVPPQVGATLSSASAVRILMKIIAGINTGSFSFRNSRSGEGK